MRIDLPAPELFEQRLRPPRQLLVTQPRPRALRPEEDVLGDRELRTDRQLLMDVRDPSPARLGRPARRVRRIAQPHRAGVRREQAGEDVEQRALPRPVLPDQRMHLPGAYVEIDAAKSDRRAEALGDGVDREDGHRPQKNVSPNVSP